MLETMAAVASAVVAAFALLFTWREVRLRALRTEDVFKWANESIATLNSLYLLIYLSRHQRGAPSDADKRNEEIIFSTSSLAEQGRLLFKNTHFGSYGTEKKPAYRGLRPLILDYLVIAHQVALEWQTASEERQAALEVIAEDCAKSFVSLAQDEVGRKSAASKEAQRGGDGSNLAYLLGEVTPNQMAGRRR